MEKAFVLISCDIGTEHETVAQLKQISEVVSVIITYGEYDIVAEIQSDSSAQLDTVITSKIRKLQKIRSTITLRVTA